MRKEGTDKVTGMAKEEVKPLREARNALQNLPLRMATYMVR